MDMQDVIHIRTTEEIIMFRKTILALAAVGSLGAAALASTPASAHWHGGWGHYAFGPRFFYRPAYTGYYDGCLRRRVAYTPWGPRVRWVNVCGY